jgi:hypothetical protein
MTDPKFIMCTVIEADKPTINGRIYPRAVLERAVEDYNKLGPTIVTAGFDSGAKPSLKDAIATAGDFRLTEDGKVVATIQLIHESSEEAAELILKMCDFSPMSIGTCDENGVIQDDLKFSYFALTPKDPAERK